MSARYDDGYNPRGAIPAAPSRPRGSAGGGAAMSSPAHTDAGIEKRRLTSPISSNARVRLPAPRPCNCMDGCPDCRTLADWRRFFRWGRRIA